MRIPQSYQTQGLKDLTANTPPLGWSAAPDLISPAGMSLANSLNHLSHSMFQQEISDELARKAKLDSEFRTKMVNANAELDAATTVAPRLTKINDKGEWTDEPASEEEQREHLQSMQQTIKEDLFNDAPEFAKQQYAPAFAQQIANSNNELLKAQTMKHAADALVGNIDVTLGMASSAQEWLQNFNPKVDPKTGEYDDPADVLKQYKEENYGIITKRMAELTQTLGPAQAKQIMAPVIQASKQQYLTLQTGLTKSLQDSAKADVDLSIQQIKSLPVDAGTKFEQIKGILTEQWGMTGEGQDALVKRLYKEYQDIAKLDMNKDLDANMHSISGLKAFIKQYSATGKDAEGNVRYKMFPDLEADVRESLLKDAHGKLDTAIKHAQSESNRLSGQDYQIALSQVQDAIRNNEVPDTAAITRLSSSARTPMQKQLVNNLIGKVNSVGWQAEAAAKDPYRFTVSTAQISPKEKQVLLQPLTMNNLETLLPQRMQFALKYGVPPISRSEAEGLAALGNVSTNKGINLVNRIVSGMPGDLKAATTGLIADSVKGKAPIFGNALAANTVDSGVAGAYINGANLIQKKATDPEVQKQIKGFKGVFAQYFKGTGLSNYTGDYDRMQEIFVGTMTGLASSGQEADPKKVLEKIGGKVVKTTSGVFGSYSMTLVPGGLDADKVVNFPRNNQPQAAADLNTTVQDLRGPLTWTPIGYKRLRDGEYVKDKSGRDLVVPFSYFQ